MRIHLPGPSGLRLVASRSSLSRVKANYEQLQAHAIALREAGRTYDDIATILGCTSRQASKMVREVLEANGGRARHPELAPLSNRVAGALIRLGIYTRADAVKFIRGGQAMRHRNIGAVAVREVCDWCGLELLQLGQISYCVRGQMDQEELVVDLQEKIRLAEQNLEQWKRNLASLRFEPRSSH